MGYNAEDCMFWSSRQNILQLYTGISSLVALARSVHCECAIMLHLIDKIAAVAVHRMFEARMSPLLVLFQELIRAFLSRYLDRKATKHNPISKNSPRTWAMCQVQRLSLRPNEDNPYNQIMHKYRKERSAPFIQATMHCECALVVNLLQQNPPPPRPIAYIGCSKLSCHVGFSSNHCNKA